MVEVVKLQVIFQSKGDSAKCPVDAVFVNANDSKHLNIKPGSFVRLSINNHLDIVCKLWVGKKCTKGIATMNRIWLPNCDSQNNTITIRQLDTCR